MTYKETIEYLFQKLPMYQRSGKIAYKADIGNIVEASKILKNPHLNFKSIHVAGTNGKGSTSHMLSSILQEAGYKVGLYTSPHLKDFRERIKINGKMISENSVINFLNEYKTTFEQINMSFFEMTVAMSFYYFHEERVDIEAFNIMAKRFNEIGRQANEEGIKFAYHNHGYGLIPEENGIIPMNIILDETNKEKVFFEMDLFWTVAGKADPIELLNKHQGRYKMLHIKDMKNITYFKGRGSTSSEWMELFPLLVPAGSGQLPLNEILKVAYNSGVEHYFIEHDLAPNPYENIQSAYDFLKALRF